MAEKIAINKLINANLYVDGNSLLGRAEEITLPAIKWKMAEHKALGMIGTLNTPTVLEKLEGKIKWSAYYEDVLKKALNPWSLVQLQVRASLEGWGQMGRESQKPVVVMMTVGLQELPLGNIKQGDNVEVESTYNCNYIKMTVDGQDIVEIDIMAGIYEVNGQDLMAEYRTNIGG